MAKQEAVTYNVPQLAKRLGVSEGLVRRQVKQGTIPHIKLGGKTLFHQDRIDQMFNK